ncbi:DUF1285 domain-containing protein [Acetobacter garciniae]
MKGELADNAQTPLCEGAMEDVSPPSPGGRHLPFLIRRDGVWLYRGTPVKRKAMVCLFASLLTRDEQGAYLLRSPFESGFITVEDVPFLAVELQWHGAGRNQRLCFRTNMDETVTADADHPIRAVWDVPPEACIEGCPPYLLIRPGDGAFGLEARLARSVWYELAALAEPGTCRGVPCLGVWSCGSFFPLARLPSENGDASMPESSAPQSPDAHGAPGGTPCV